jgi:hypothetical protein
LPSVGHCQDPTGFALAVVDAPEPDDERRAVDEEPDLADPAPAGPVRLSFCPG